MLTTNLARGGAESQVAQLALALGARGHNVGVISLLPPAVFQNELAGAGIPVHSLRMTAGTIDPRGAMRLARILRRLRPQVLHAHMFHANLMARAIRLVCPVSATISTIHSMAESPRGSADASRRDVIYRATDPLSSATVCVSRAVADRHLAARAVSARRLHVIPNGVDTSRFLPRPGERERLRRELGLNGEFVWLAVGRLMWKKNFPAMLRAFALQGSGVLLVAGEGPQESELRALASGLGGDVRFLGARDNIPALMNAADALVLSSVVEGLPMVLLEAAATGLPCAAADVGGTREAVLDGITGFVAAAPDLAAAMTRLAALAPGELRRMGEAARRHVVENFEIAVVAARWEQLYSQLLETAPWM